MAMPGADLLLANRIGVRARGTRLVERARLRALLESAPEARLVLVAAPAGFGKSTLLSAWLGGAEVHGAWLSLDARDDDVVRFARYLEAAAAQLAGIESAGGRDPAHPFDAELALARVLDLIDSALQDGPAGGAVIVLDDYHVIDEPAVHRLVAALVERLPPRARLAIATRVDPPLPLARLRARGELLEVRAEDLRFTASEAGELLCSAAVELAPAEVDELTERTEGWAAALRLAAVSLRGRPDQAGLVRRFGASHRFVLDYVVEEVLAGLPSETQDFLLRTSVLDRLCGPLCDAVTGREDGQARLEELERANLLIIPLDDERRWYRYHALFAEVLRARLRILDSGGVPELHARAATWHRAHGHDDEAIAHALLSDDLGGHVPARGRGLAVAPQRRGAEHSSPLARRPARGGRPRRRPAQRVVRLVPRPPGRDRGRGRAARRRRARPCGRSRRRPDHHRRRPGPAGPHPVAPRGPRGRRQPRRSRRHASRASSCRQGSRRRARPRCAATP